MARSRTLAQIRSDVRYYADVEGLTDRHPDANINRLINESWQALRELVTEQGSPLFLTTTTGTTEVGAAAQQTAFGSIAMPGNALRIYGVDIEVNGVIHPLEPLPFGARNDWQDRWNADATGVPVGFVVYSIGMESADSVTAGSIALIPAADAVYNWRVWFLPHWADVLADGDVFNTYAGWEQWVIWDCVAKLAARDNDSRATYTIAERERERAQARVLQSARVQRAGPLVVQDSRARRKLNRWRAQRDWP